MSAPAKASGGKSKRLKAAPSVSQSTRGSARPRPRRYDTTTSSRPRILEVARSMAAELGYERLKLSDITRGAEISHQGFYIHFKNKRHAVAVATSDQLGAVASLVNSSSKQDEAWAKRLEEEIDMALAEAYPTEDGPESRLRAKLVEVIETNTFNQTRIEHLVRASGLSHGEFYRRYGGKRPCLQRIYGQAMEEVEREIAGERTFISLAEALASDPDRATLLVIGSSYLPRGPELEAGVATQQSFPAMVNELVAASGDLTAFEVDAISGAAIEVIRSCVIARSFDSLRGGLRLVATIPTERSVPIGDQALAA